MAAQEDIESVAGQLATLTLTVEEMAKQLAALRGRADTQQEQADIQKERIDLAARELAEVSERLRRGERASPGCRQRAPTVDLIGPARAASADRSYTRCARSSL
jgi:chromosome segregation ATPase